MALEKNVLDAADRWWALDFACQADQLRPARTRVQEHTGQLADASGIWILVVGPSPLVSLPRSAMDPLANRAQGWSRSLVRDRAALAAELRPLEIEKIVGPAFIGYGTARGLELGLADGARALTPADAVAVAKLRAACAEEEWDHGGSDHDGVPTFGCVSPQGELLALAGYKVWGGEIAHISIVSAPHQRGRGFAKRAVARAAQHALSAGLIPQYRTLASNAPAMAVAGCLGFEEYGFSVFVRLGTDRGLDAR